MLKFYVIWKRPNNTYYQRYVWGTYARYYIGYKNQYNHEVVLIFSPDFKDDNSIKGKLRRFFYWLYKKL